MASGDTLVVLVPTDNEPPASAYATFDVRNGHSVLAFDDTDDQAAIFSFVLPSGYAGGGLTVRLHYSMGSAAEGKVRLDVSFERIGNQVLNVDSDSFAGAQSALIAAVPSESGLTDVVTVPFADGSEIDGLMAGDLGRIRIERKPTDASNDTASGDLELHAVEIRES